MAKQRQEPTFSKSGSFSQASSSEIAGNGKQEMAFKKAREQSAMLDLDEDERPRGRANVANARSGPRSGGSALAVLALLLAAGAAGFNGWLYTQLSAAENRAADAETRLTELESLLAVTGDESEQSLAALQVKLKTLGDAQAEADSEIRKLWGVANDRNKKALSEQKVALGRLEKQFKGLQSQVDEKISSALAEKLQSVRGDISLVNDLVDAQQSALSKIEKSASEARSAAAAAGQKSAALEARLKEVDEAITAFDAFRLSVTRDINALKNPSL